MLLVLLLTAVFVFVVILGVIFLLLFQVISVFLVRGQGPPQTTITTLRATACARATPRGASANRGTTAPRGPRNPHPAARVTTVPPRAYPTSVGIVWWGTTATVEPSAQTPPIIPQAIYVLQGDIVVSIGIITTHFDIMQDSE